MMWNYKQYESNVAVINDLGERITYRELDGADKALCARIKKRCLVFSLCTNSIGSLLGYTGFINGNIVPLLLSSDLDHSLLSHLIEVYKPSYLWIPAAKAALFDFCKTVYETYGYVLLKTNFDFEYPLFEDLALLLTTSGSTGSPKLVRQSYKNIAANTNSIVQYLELDETERPITTLPMNYTYGLSIINSHLSCGATILLTDRTLLQKEFWRFFKEQGATSFGGVPYTYEILDKLRFFRMNLPSLRTMTQAGGRLSTDLHAKFAQYARDKSKHFIVMYGQTEATARMAYLPYDKSLDKIGSMGISIPGGAFLLIDENAKEIDQPGRMGELIYKGKNVTLGYAECGEDLNKGDERGGVLHTGDMAKRDEDGFYYIVGRKKRFLKVFGNRVNLDETERLIKAQYPKMDCACVGRDDNMQIFITDKLHDKEVQKFISEKTGLNLVAFHVTFIPDIPKNESGKTLYTKLSELR